MEDKLTRLHQLVLAHQTGAAELCAATLIKPLHDTIARRFHGVDPAIVHDAVVDAVMSYLARPAMYDPSKARLDTFLARCARNRLITSLTRARRLRAAEVAVASETAVSVVLEVEGKHTGQLRRRLLASVRSEQERLLLIARLEGLRNTKDLAERLGCKASKREQSDLVKRITERLRQRWKRFA